MRDDRMGGCATTSVTLLCSDAVLDSEAIQAYGWLLVYSKYNNKRK